MAILRRAKIRGANAPQDQRDDAWEEIAGKPWKFINKSQKLHVLGYEL